MYTPKTVRMLIVLIASCLPAAAYAEYVKAPQPPSETESPPDADKPATGSDRTCWLATASNMLAGAGYGEGSDVQARAEDIYAQLKAHYNSVAPGW